MERQTASDDEMRTRKQLVDRVDAVLSRHEQETTMQFFGDADRFQITTYRPTMVRSLLEHAYAEIEWLYLGVPEGRNTRVQEPSEVLRSDSQERIEGICARLPLGALSIKGSPRNEDQHSGIVTTPADVEGLADVFA